MRCMHCGGETVVIDTRPIRRGETIRRRRICLKCEKRFSTYELAVYGKARIV